MGRERRSRKGVRLAARPLIRDHGPRLRPIEGAPESIDRARESLRALVTEAYAQVVTSAEVLAKHKGVTAGYDQARDRPFAALSGFAPAVDALTELPQFVRAFGEEHGERATLYFLYDYFKRTDQLTLDEPTFDATFDALITEIDDPNWTYVSFANLRGFQSDDALIDFGDGLTIRHRSLEDLEDMLGWTEWHLGELTRDWQDGHTASSHVIWVEVVEEKTPQNAIQSSSGYGTRRVLDLLLALQLFAPGDVTIGAIFSDRAARFEPAGHGLARALGMPGQIWGGRCTLSADDAPAIRAIYDDLVGLRSVPDVPSNVLLALRRFSSVYTRDFRQREDRIIDELIALEALAGSGTELRFRLAFRVSSLLGSDDEERLALFDAMKDYYDVRSTIVHGGELKTAERELAGDDSELRAIVRRLLRSVIFATVHSDFRLSADYVHKELDKALLDTRKRNELREALKLS